MSSWFLPNSFINSATILYTNFSYLLLLKTKNLPLVFLEHLSIEIYALENTFEYTWPLGLFSKDLY